MSTKFCAGCNSEKDLDDFYKSSATNDKHQPRCKSCQQQQAASRRTSKTSTATVKPADYDESDADAADEGVAQETQDAALRLDGNLNPDAVSESPAAPKPVKNADLAFKHTEDDSTPENELLARLRRLASGVSLISVVPPKLRAFVPFGKFDRIKTIIQSREFLPVFIAGPTGNGKTTFPEQACAQLGREFINCDITSETDEDDLIGGIRLRNGETYFEMGPALVAALRGSVLVLNELDTGTPKIMCLQRLLEGKPVVVKKLGVVVTPAPGFTVFATANTKGRGDETGRYIGTGLLNEAFLRRFAITYEQEYPPVAVEKKILVKTFETYGGTMNAQILQFFDTLSKWADGIRESYAKQAVEEVISTRELCHIVHVFKVFGGDREAQEIALEDCTTHFDGKTRDAFIDLYNKIAPDTDAVSNVGTLKDPFA